jgi:uroporphyrinogen-III synthase
MLTAPAVLVTRPAAEGMGWVAELQARGISAEALPLIEIAPIADVLPAQACWAALHTYASLMFVSGNAVEGFFAARPASAGAFHSGLRFMAPGPGTAKRLLRAGVPAAQIDTPPHEAAQFDSQSLWEVVGQRTWAGQRVLIVRGQSSVHVAQESLSDGAAPGRDWLARCLIDRGAAVDFVSVYQRRPPLLSRAAHDRVRRSQHDGSVWLFSSSEALAHLSALPGLERMDWSQARAIATHPRIAQAAREAGWGVVIESRPALADIVASIESSFP